MIRSLVVLVTALMLSGCSGGGVGESEPRTTTVTEDQAIAFATDAVRENDNFADTAAYTAVPIGNGWQINVLDENTGEFRMIVLDGDGGVLEYNR